MIENYFSPFSKHEELKKKNRVNSTDRAACRAYRIIIIYLFMRKMYISIENIYDLEGGIEKVSGFLNFFCKKITGDCLSSIKSEMECIIFNYMPGNRFQSPRGKKKI